MIYLATLQPTIDDKLSSYIIIKSVTELYKLLSDNTTANKVIISKDFATKFFTPSSLSDFVIEAKKVNRNLIVELDKDSEVLTIPKFVEKLNRCVNFEEIFYLGTKYKKEFMDTIHYLCNDIYDTRDEVLQASNNISMLQSVINAKNKEIEMLQNELALERENKHEVSSRLNALVSRINYQYNKDIDENKMFEVDFNNYDKVIYIKEVTRVQYVDSLVHYLTEISKVLFNMPSRCVVIESYYGTQKVDLYPTLTPHYALSEQDVMSGNILMLGMQPKLMSDILKNSSHISILIVLDRGGYKFPHITGPNVEYIFTASDSKDVSDVIPRNRVISYGKDTLFIPMIKGFDKMDNTERMTKYSSMLIVKQLIQLITGV